MPIFSDLSYNNKTLKPIGRPVDDLKALYKDKKEDYITALDGAHTAKTLLNQVPYNEKDEHVVNTAQSMFDNTFNKFEEEGDWENKIPDVKRLSNDVVNKYGLLRVQKNALARTGYVEELQAKVDKGEMSSEHMNELIDYSDRHYDGVQKNETTGGYTGTYDGRTAQPWVDVSKEVVNIMKGFKDNSILWKTPDGVEHTLVKSKDGWITATTGVAVSEEDIAQASKAYVESNDLIQSQFKEKIFLEMDKKGEVTTADLRKAFQGRTTQGIKDYFDVDTVPTEAEIENMLKEKDITPEQAYNEIRKEQLTDEAIETAVVKESFSRYKTQFLQDWTKKQTKAETVELPARQQEVLIPYDNVQNYGIGDIKKTAKVLEDTRAHIKDMEREYITVSNSGDAQRAGELKTQIEKEKFTLNAIENQQQNIFYNTDMTKYFNSFKSAQNANLYGTFDLGVAGLKKLTYAELNDGLTNNLIDENVQMLSEEEWNTTKEKDKGKEYKNSSSSSKYETYKDYTDNVYKVVRNITRGATASFEEQLDDNPRDYVSTYNTLAFEGLTDKERKEHPLMKAWDPIYNLNNPETGIANAYESMSSVATSKDVKTQIMEDFDLDENEILWKTAKYTPNFDYRPDTANAQYRPSVTLKVDILTGEIHAQKKTKRISMPVFYNSPHYETVVKESLAEYRQQLVNKSKIRPLVKSEMDLLNRTNLSLYNSSEYGREIDLLNLYNTPNNADTPVKITEGLNRNVRTFTNDSPSGQHFYMTVGTGENALFPAENSKENYEWFTEADMRTEKVQNRIASGDLNFVGGDTVDALKTTFAAMAIEADTYGGDNLNNLVDISSDPVIKFAPGKSFEVNSISESARNSAHELYNKYPSLLVTDISRNTNTEVEGSAAASAHKVSYGANALDFRANDSSDSSRQAKQVHNLTESEKKDLGIKKTLLHGEGNNIHLHVEFINK